MCINVDDSEPMVAKEKISCPARFDVFKVRKHAKLTVRDIHLIKTTEKIRMVVT